MRLLFVLLLALGLFSSELGELFRLADDISNDYVRVSESSLHDKGTDIASQGEISQISVAVAEKLIPNLTVVPFVKPLFGATSDDLLQLISVQRK